MPARDDANVEKRTDVLALLAAFAAAKVSEGCSCLNLQPKATTTNTYTALAPVRLLNAADFGQMHMR